MTIWPDVSLGEGMALVETVHEAYGVYLEPLSAADLGRVVAYTNSAGAAFENTVADILTQVVTHGQYHRGKANASLRQAGMTPVPLDYIAWVRGVPAATTKP